MKKPKREDTTQRDNTYRAAREEAQTLANSDGFDRGLEWNPIFKQWRIFTLPAKCNRYGFETRCEAVSCEIAERCQPGHGVLSHVFLR